MKTFLKTMMLVGTAFVMSACGGGGGGDDAPKKPTQVVPVNNPLAISGSSLRLDVDENGSAEFPLNYSGADGDITLSVDTSENGETPEWLALDLSNPALITATVGEIKNELDHRITLIADDGKDTSSFNFRVYATNTSVVALLEKLNTYQTAIGRYVEQSEELEYANRALDLASMTNPSASSLLINQLKSKLRAAVTGPGSETLMQASQQSLESDYTSGVKSEDDLIATLEQIKTETDTFSAEVSAVLNEIVALLPDSKMALDVSSTFMLSELNNLSRFVGNPEFGELIDGEWVFKPDYAFLEAIVTPSSLTCNAQ